MDNLGELRSFYPGNFLKRERKRRMAAATHISHEPIGNDPLDPNRLCLDNGIHQGDFFVGPIIPPINAAPVTNIAEYLAKSEHSEDFVTLKVLLNKHPQAAATMGTTGGGGGGGGDVATNNRQAKVLLHNEHLILSLLQDQPGVVHHHGLFKDRNRFILVLDCLVAHSFGEGKCRDFVNLQHYVIKEKRLTEKEALELFYSIATTVQSLHRKNIVHRDLKLGNMVLNTRTRAVTLTNFALSKHLVRGNDPLTDQRGSLAYVSPDVLSGTPYDGKASDMWAMGVLLYTMLYGQFPFYDNDPEELFKKIRAADYTMPNDVNISYATSMLIQQLIEKEPRKRLTAAVALENVQNILSRLSVVRTPESAAQVVQVVPDIDKSSPADCTVPDQDDSPSASLTMATAFSYTSSIDMNAVRLTLSPMLFSAATAAESHGSHMISHSNDGVHMVNQPMALQAISVATSPHGVMTASPNSSHFFPYVLTEVPPSHLPRPRASAGANQNPFIQPCSTPPSSVYSSSPTGFPNSSSALSSRRRVTHEVPGVNQSSPTAPSGSLICHRYPIALSLSTDSYFTSSSPSSSSSSSSSSSLPPQPMHIASHSSGGNPPFSSYGSPSHLSHSSLSPNSVREQVHRHIAATAAPSSTSSRGRYESVIVSNQSVMDSLVTVRTSPSHHSVGSNRHSFTEGEALSPHLVVPSPSASSSSSQRRRRNSSGSEQRIRRHSQPQGVYAATTSLDSSVLSVRRPRRRSHDARDEQMEILERLGLVAGNPNGRRTSRVQVRVTAPPHQRTQGRGT